MDVTRFRRVREAHWRQLETLINTSKRPANPEALRAFVQLYRQTASDLAYARTYFPSHSVTSYLNNLVTTAYPRLYRFKRGGQQNLLRFLFRGFPTLFREFFGYILLAAIVSLAGGLYGFILTHASPQAAYHLLPATLVRNIHPNQTGPHAVIAPIISSAIMTHNMLVALEALYALWQNGLIVGTLAAMFQAKHRTTVFWSLIVPHGVTELTAIFIAGGAGLLFAHYLMAPRQMSRMRALRFGATKAVQLVLGTVPMLIIAGTIEGFLTPSNVPVWIKFGTAVVTGVAWLIYFGVAGRKQPTTESTAIAVADTPTPYPPQRPLEGIRRY
jgi:uncharacterized membrane protein SpoIIM required for sporulation